MTTLRSLSWILLLVSGTATAQAQPSETADMRQPGGYAAARRHGGGRDTLIYRLDTQTIPKNMLPWVRRGVEEWVAVFDSMGIGPKILIKEQPYTSEPDVAGAAPGCWIGWGIAFPAGPGAADNQAEAHDDGGGRWSIVIDSSLVAGEQRLFFLAVGGQPPGLHFPFPDSITGMLVQFIAAHEVGHTLERDHHFRQGTIYPTDSLRSADFLRRHHGFTGSIMAYAALNYVAQPEDHVPVRDLVMHVGMYDRWETYRRYTPEAQRPTGERLRAIEDTAPHLRATVNFTGDPNNQVRAVGTDPVRSTEYAMRNMARALPRIDSQRIANPKLPDQLKEDFLMSWSGWMGHALAAVGGNTLAGPVALDPDKTPIAPIDSAHQVEALRFVLAHVFQAGDPILRGVSGTTLPDTALVLFETTAPGWAVEKWRLAQSTLLTDLTGRLPTVALQSKTTHVLPVMCAELTKLNTRLTQAAAATTSAAARAQAEQLEQVLTPLLDPLFGTCTPESPTGPASGAGGGKS